MAYTETFEKWLQAVSKICQKKIGLCLEDLPDVNTRAAYDKGFSPEDFYKIEIQPTVKEYF